MSENSTVNLINALSELWDPATDLEADVFVSRGYARDKEELAGQYAKYLDSTEMLVALREADTQISITACARVIRPSERGFKTLDDARDPKIAFSISDEGWSRLADINPENMYELATTAARPGAGAEIYGGIIGYGLDAEKRRQYALVSSDEYVYQKLLKPLFGDAFTSLGPTVDYFGSPTSPILIDLNQGWNNLESASRHSEVHARAFARVAVGRRAILSVM